MFRWGFPFDVVEFELRQRTLVRAPVHSFCFADGPDAEGLPVAWLPGEQEPRWVSARRVYDSRDVALDKFCADPMWGLACSGQDSAANRLKAFENRQRATGDERTFVSTEAIVQVHEQRRHVYAEVDLKSLDAGALSHPIDRAQSNR